MTLRVGTAPPAGSPPPRSARADTDPDRCVRGIDDAAGRQARLDRAIGAGRYGYAAQTEISGLGAPVLFLALRDDPERIVGQRPLQRQSVNGVSLKPSVNLGGRREDDRHGLGVNRSDDGVRFSRQEPEELMLALDRSALGTAYAVPGRPQCIIGTQISDILDKT